jgi:hypothetical protein
MTINSPRREFVAGMSLACAGSLAPVFALAHFAIPAPVFSCA